MKVRFNLRWLLALIATLGVLLAVVTQIGMGRAEFEVYANELVLNERGLVKGRLSCGYVGTESDSVEAWPFDVEFNNVADQNYEFRRIRPGRKVAVRYRMMAVGPLKKQDPFKMYLHHLGVEPNEVVGHVITEAGTKVIIDGFRTN